MRRSCQRCGGALPVGAAHWVTYCIGCFKAVKREELDTLYQQIESLNVERALLRVEITLYEKRTNKLAAELDRVKQLLSGDMAKKLLMLCHPDRHDNSAMSNEVTRYIIELRKRTGV